MTNPTLDSHKSLGIIAMLVTSQGTGSTLAHYVKDLITDTDAQHAAPDDLSRLRTFWQHYGQALAVSGDGLSISTTRMQGGGSWAPEPGYRLVSAHDVGIAIFGPELFRLISDA